LVGRPSHPLRGGDRRAPDGDAGCRGRRRGRGLARAATRRLGTDRIRRRHPGKPGPGRVPGAMERDRGESPRRPPAGGGKGWPRLQSGPRGAPGHARGEPPALGGAGPRTNPSGSGDLDGRTAVSGRIGVLAMAYGTAAGPGDVERYYTDIRGGRPPTTQHLEV